LDVGWWMVAGGMLGGGCWMIVARVSVIIFRMSITVALVINK